MYRTMKILFVLGQLPYPPRNGVTIPTYNYLTGLAERHEVSLLLVRDGTRESQSINLEENATLVENLWEIDAPLKPRLVRIANELSGSSIYHIGRHYDTSVLSPLCSRHGFDVIWISNSVIFDIIHPLKEIFGKDLVYVAGLNDSLTEGFRGAIRVIALRGWSPRERVSLFSRWLRSWRLGAIEKKLLAPFDLILVQSIKDQQVLDRISDRCSKKILVLSNGVDHRLFSTTQSAQKKDLLFVGSLRGYSPLVEWILTKVWSAIRERHVDATMTIVGRDASESLLKRVKEDHQITYIPFVEDIQDIYRDRMLAILPVRKTSGLINKVVESMAAGVPVVGDSGSFNAIPGFKDGVHGIVANDANEMAGTVLRLLEDDNARTKMASAAKELVHKYFAWEDRIAVVNQSLETLTVQSGDQPDSVRLPLGSG